MISLTRLSHCSKIPTAARPIASTQCPSGPHRIGWIRQRKTKARGPRSIPLEAHRQEGDSSSGEESEESEEDEDSDEDEDEEHEEGEEEEEEEGLYSRAVEFKGGAFLKGGWSPVARKANLSEGDRLFDDKNA